MLLLAMKSDEFLGEGCQGNLAAFLQVIGKYLHNYGSERY
jgi:hypothetical protein